MSDIDHLHVIAWGISNIERYAKYRANKKETKEMVRRAAAFELIMIGEAATKVTAECKIRYADIPWKAMVATRHRLAHQPWNVSDEILDNIVREQIPTLKAQITALMSHL